MSEEKNLLKECGKALAEMMLLFCDAIISVMIGFSEQADENGLNQLIKDNPWLLKLEVDENE